MYGDSLFNFKTNVMSKKRPPVGENQHTYENKTDFYIKENYTATTGGPASGRLGKTRYHEKKK